MVGVRSRSHSSKISEFLIPVAYTERCKTPVPTESAVKVRNKKENPAMRRGRFCLVQIHRVSEQMEA